MMIGQERVEKRLADLVELSGSSQFKNKMKSIELFKEIILTHPFQSIINSTVLTIASLFSHT